MTLLKEDFILWRSSQIEKATEGSLIGNDFSVFGVSIDSRSVKAGDLFIALKGPNSDGHDYVEEAKNKGAIAAIVSEKHVNYGDFPLIVVNDTYKALLDLARFSRFRFMGKVVGITGSVGKTGFKDFLTFILSKQGRVCSTEGNNNNLYGVPLSLANLAAWHSWGVFEMGMNVKGEMAQLTDLVKPNIAIITKVSAAHSANFNSVEEIAEEKSKITESEDTSTVLVYHDMPFYEFLIEKIKSQGINHIISYGKISNSNLKMVDFQFNADTNMSHIKCDIFGQRLEYSIPVLGEHYGLMSVAALGVAHLMGANLKRAMDYISQYEIPSGRGNIVNLNLNSKKITLIDDSYNANTTSVAEAIKVLSKMKVSIGGSKILVLGDMHELKDEIEQHTNLASIINPESIDRVCTLGPRMKHLFNILPESKKDFATESVEELIQHLEKTLKPNDIILIKGSKASRASKVADYFKNKYCIIHKPIPKVII